MNDELQAKRRRSYWPLKMLLANKVFSVEASKLALVITKGDFDAETIYNELRDAKAKMLVDLDYAIEGVYETIWLESQSKDQTTYGFEVWKRRMIERRRAKQNKTIRAKHEAQK